jgi:hypothetical protein
MTKIYIDENFAQQLADGLNVFQEHLNHSEKLQFEVLSIKKEFGRGALDEVWIPVIGKEKAVVITQDLRIQTTRHQNELYKQHGLGVFFFKPPSTGYSFWEMVQHVIKNWPEIKTKTKDRRPFAYRYKSKGKLEKLD